MNRDMPERETIVIGGSYPGAMSAWFRSRYPHLAMASWSSSGVVQPITDFWHFDEQVYTSSVKSGDFCPKAIKESIDYITEQGLLRNDGVKNNAINRALKGTSSEGMNTGDYMFYYADIFVESVQYGNRTLLCDTLEGLAGSDQDVIFQQMVDFGTNVAGVNPPDYDSIHVISDETIDPYSSARPWTYQYCTEYGFFQVPSHEHPMRSEFLELPYWPAMCERSFKGLNMKEMHLPAAFDTTVDQGGFDIKGTNTFFANGSEDPWQWATVRDSNDSLNQVARTSECTDCGHCAELYTPADSDPQALKDTRQMVADWIDALLAPQTSVFLQ